MHVWGDEIEIIDARTQPASNQEFWTAKAKGEYSQVHGHFYARLQDWEQLPAWRRDRLRTIAVGVSLRTSVLIARSSCRLWDIPLIEHEAPAMAAVTEGAKLRGRKYWPKGVVMKQIHIPEADIIESNGLRYTWLRRTVIDQCRFGTFADGLVAVEGYLRRPENTSLHSLRLKMESMGRVAGIRKVQRVLKCASPLSESVAESFAKAVIVQSGLVKRLEQQVEVCTPEGEYRLDFVADNWLNIEVDGQSKYEGDDEETRDVLLRERARERAILNAGFTMIRASWRGIASGELLVDIKNAYKRREALLRVAQSG